MSLLNVRNNGGIVWGAVTEPFRCELGAVGKTNEKHKHIVGLELICTRLAALAGIPSAHGAVLVDADREEAPDGLVYVSFLAYPEGEPPAPPTPKVIARQPKFCAAAVAFDCWTMNEDRTYNNVIFAPDLGVPFTLIDFEGSLCANDRDVTADHYRDQHLVGGQLHGFVTDAAHLQSWVTNIRQVPDAAIRRACDEAAAVGAMQRWEVDAVYDALIHRRDHLGELLMAARGDPARHETHNVGVVVTDGHSVRGRFLGQRSDGILDLRHVPNWVASKKTYRTWVDHWRYVVGGCAPEDLPDALVPATRPGNYLILPERRFLRWVGPSDLDVVVKELFAELVAPAPTARRDDELVRLCTQVLAPFQAHPKLLYREDVALPAPLDADHQQPLNFHYSIKNGLWHHMRRLTLTPDEAPSWDRVRATVYLFEQLEVLAGHETANRVSLVRYDPEEADLLEDQLFALERHGPVVNVATPKVAQESIAHLVGVN